MTDRLVHRVVLCALLVAGLSLPLAAEPTSAEMKALLPPGMSASWLVRFAKPLPEDAARGAHLALDPDGRALLVLGDRLVVVRPDMAPASDTMRVEGIDRVDEVAMTPGGDLLAISGRRLGQIGDRGFSLLLELPSAGMKLRAASPNECYLFGGDDPAYLGDVYLYRKGGGLLRLVRSERPVTAVAGTGRFTFLAMGRTICVLADGEPLRAVFSAPEDVTDLALLPPAGVVFATGGLVGYVSRPGAGFVFLKAKGARVAAHGDEVYAFLADKGLVRFTPGAALERMAADILKFRTGGTRPTAAAQAAIDRGIDAAQRKDWDAATARFKEALEETPYCPELMLNLAQAAEAAGGREVLAVCWYRAFVALAPASPEAPLVRVKIIELTARARANVYRLRLEGLDGLRRLAAESAGEARDGFYSDAAWAQVRANDLAGARATAALIAGESARDGALGNIASAMGAQGNVGGALEAIAQIRAASQAEVPRARIAMFYAGVGALDAAEATVRAMSSKAAMDDAYANLADEMVARGRPADAARLAGMAGDAKVLRRVYAAIAVKQAEAGDAEAGRRTVALGAAQDAGDAATATRLATFWATLGEADEARKSMSGVEWKDGYFWRMYAAKEVALRLHAKGRDAEARAILGETLDAAAGLDREIARDWTRCAVVEALCGMGDAAGAEDVAWLIEGRAQRGYALVSVMAANGQFDRAEADSCARLVLGYDAYPQMYAPVRDLGGHLDSLKGQPPASVYNSLLSAADTLDAALGALAASEKSWQDRRAAKK